MLRIKDNNQAREMIAECGITCKNVTHTQLKSLWRCLQRKMVESQNYDGTYMMNPGAGKFMTCRCDHWEEREAVSFNEDGFIGFAGWADSSNIRPILDGVEMWLKVLGYHERLLNPGQFVAECTEFQKKKSAVVNVLGAKIKKLRKKKGLTLEQLAKKIGSGKSYIWEIENKGVKRPSAEKLAAIAKELDVTTDFLIDDTQTEVTDDLEKEVFYRKLGQLEKDDRDKIMDMIDAWSKK